MPDRIAVAQLNELPEHTSTVVAAGEREIALFRVGQEAFAIDNECPHREGPLGYGDQEGAIVTCPFHGWQIDVRTGQVVDFPSECAKTHPVEIEDGMVYVLA